MPVNLYSLLRDSLNFYGTSAEWAASSVLDAGQTTATTHDFTVDVPSGGNRAALVSLGTDVANVAAVVIDPSGENIALTRVRDWSIGITRISLWRLFEVQMPASGSYTLRVTLNTDDEVLGQWQSARRVEQTVYASGNWEMSLTDLPVRADRVYAEGSLAYAAMMDSSQRTGWTVSELFKKLELQNLEGGDTFVAARGRLTVDGAPEPIFSNASSAARLVGFQAFLQPSGSATPALRTIDRPATGDWTDHGTKISRVASTWEDGIATTSGTNGLAALEWRDRLYCLYLGYDGDRSDGGAKHRAMGYATSDDGVTWTKYGSNPVITHQGTGQNNEEEGVWGFAAAINPNNDELNVVWGALQATGATSVRADVSLTVTDDGISWSDNTLTTNLIIIDSGAGVFLGTSGEAEAYGFALGWNTVANRWELWYLTKNPEDWHVYHVHANDLANLSNANDADWFSQSDGTVGRNWRIGTFVDRRNGNRDLMFNRYTTGGQFEVAYRPVNSPPAAGSMATLYDFDALDSTTKRGYSGITPASKIGKWVLPYWLTAEGGNDRTEGIRFKTATIIYASAASGSPADDGGGAQGSALIRPSFELTSGQDANPSGARWWNPTDGSDGNDGTTKALAKKTLNAAEGALGAERTVIVVGGIHNDISPITLSANDYTVQAEQGTTVVLDFGPFGDFAVAPNTLWEQSGVYWRTKNNGEFTAGALNAMWIEGGVNGEAWAIRDEISDGNNDGTGADYPGPTIRVNSDGRIYLRFDKPNTAYTTDDFPAYQPGWDKGSLQWTVPSQTPNDTALYIRRKATNDFAINLNSRSNVHFKDLNFRGRFGLFRWDGGSTSTGCTWTRCTGFGNFTFIVDSGVTVNNCEIKGGKWFMAGRLDYYPWDLMKGDGVHSGNDWDQDNFMAGVAGTSSGWIIEDNLIYGGFDYMNSARVFTNLTERFNWYDAIFDDMYQTGVGMNGHDFGFNVVRDTPFYGFDFRPGEGDGTQYKHHNIVWQRLPRVKEPGNRPGTWFVVTLHGGAIAGEYQPMKIYNNTIITNTSLAAQLAHQGGDKQNNLHAQAHELYNNIIMVFGDEFWTNARTSERDSIVRFYNLDGTSNEMYDNNHYVRLLAYSPANNAEMFSNFQDRVGVGNFNFNRLSDLQASGANVIDAEANGTDAQAVGVGLVNMNGHSTNPFDDLEGNDFHIKVGNAAKTGAKSLTGESWPSVAGITADSERGAYGGGNTQVGPRSSVLNY